MDPMRSGFGGAVSPSAAAAALSLSGSEEEGGRSSQATPSSTPFRPSALLTRGGGRFSLGGARPGGYQRLDTQPDAAFSPGQPAGGGGGGNDDGDDDDEEEASSSVFFPMSNVQRQQQQQQQQQLPPSALRFAQSPAAGTGSGAGSGSAFGNSSTSGGGGAQGPDGAIGAHIHLNPGSGVPLSLASGPAPVKSSDEIDTFLQQFYAYFAGKGFACLVLDRFLNLIAMVFLIVFATFVTVVVDYGELLTKNQLWVAVHWDAVYRMPFFLAVVIFSCSVYWLVKLWHFFYDLKWITEQRNFYRDGIRITENELQIIEWHELVSRLVAANGDGRLFGTKLNAHQIANRIMRRENYLIGLFNRDVLKLGMPFVSPVIGDGTTVPMLTTSLEYNLRRAIFGFMLDNAGNLKRNIDRSSSRSTLAAELRRVFILQGFMNLLLAPVIGIVLLVYFIFRYGEEIRKAPAKVGSRQYTIYAHWKFREFNEYSHLLDVRLSASYPKAEKYLQQFPQEYLAIIARFVSFIVGAIAFVLGVLSIVDENVLLKLEISPGRAVIWYIGVFGVAFTTARSLIPDEKISTIFRPDAAMRDLAEDTHFLPERWQNKLKSEEVRDEFCAYYQSLALVYLYELFSVITTPFIMMAVLPQSAEGIIDFFRMTTISVDGVGSMCSLAQFDFSRSGHLGASGGVYGPEGALRTKDAKLEKSILNFKANHPEWEPPENGEVSDFLQKLGEFMERTRQAEANSMFSSRIMPPYVGGEAAFASEAPTRSPAEAMASSVPVAGAAPPAERQQRPAIRTASSTDSMYRSSTSASGGITDALSTRLGDDEVGIPSDPTQSVYRGNAVQSVYNKYVESLKGGRSGVIRG